MAPPPPVNRYLRHRRRVKPRLYPQVQGRFDDILHINLRRKPLDVKTRRGQPPGIAQAADGNIPIHLAAKEGGGVAVGRFQRRWAGRIAHSCQYRRLGAHPGGVAGMSGFNHCAGVGGQPAGAGGGDAQSHLRLRRIQSQSLGGGRRAAQRPDQSRRMVRRRGSRGRCRPQPSLNFPAQSVGYDNLPPGCPLLFRQRQGRRQAGGSAVGGRETLNFIVEAVAENPVGKGGRRRIGAVAPTHYRAVRRAPAVPPIAADDVSQFLHRPGSHISHPVQNGDFSRRHYRRRQSGIVGVGNKTGQGSSSIHKVSVLEDDGVRIVRDGNYIPF